MRESMESMCHPASQAALRPTEREKAVPGVCVVSFAWRTTRAPAQPAPRPLKKESVNETPQILLSVGFAPLYCPEGMLQLGNCRMHHFWARLFVVGYFRFFSKNCAV